MSLASPERWFMDWAMGGGGPVSAGVTVNERTALHSTAVYACVRILAETLASLPLHVYKRRSDGGKERAPTHPLYNILHDLPNEEMTSFTLFETLMGHLATWGNAYAEIEWDGSGRVAAVWPLRPDQTWVNRDAKGRLWYHTTIPRSNQVAVLPDFRVLHIPGLGFDGLVGYSPIYMQREAIGLTLATEKYGATFFGNGAKPGGVLEHPNNLSKDAQDRLRANWNEMHQGLEKQHRIAILEEGMTYKQIGLPPEDSQFLQTRKFQLQEIARIYRVPPHMIADLERSTNNNIEHQSIDFVVHTLRPWLVRWEKAIFQKLLSPRERRSFFAEFLVDGLLRGDIKSRSEALAVQRQNGVINGDEWREIENRNPTEDGSGKIYLVNGAMVPIHLAGQNVKGGDGTGQGEKTSKGSDGKEGSTGTD